MIGEKLFHGIRNAVPLFENALHCTYVCTVPLFFFFNFVSLYLLMHLSLIFFVSYLLPLLNALSGPVRYHE